MEESLSYLLQASIYSPFSKSKLHCLWNFYVCERRLRGTHTIKIRSKSKTTHLCFYRTDLDFKGFPECAFIENLSLNIALLSEGLPFQIAKEANTGCILSNKIKFLPEEFSILSLLTNRGAHVFLSNMLRYTEHKDI